MNDLMAFIEMKEDSSTSPDGTETIFEPLKSRPCDQEAELRQALRRCPPVCFDAALRFRETKGRDLIEPVLRGLLSPYAGKDLMSPEEQKRTDYHLASDLLLDSLDQLELSLSIDEVFQLRIDTEQLLSKRSFSELVTLIDVTLKAQHAARELAALRPRVLKQKENKAGAPFLQPTQAYPAA